MTLRALLFDVDGTLADTEEAHRQAFNGAFARHGYNWTWNRDGYRELLKVTGGRERIAHFIRGLGLGEARERECLREVPELHGTKTALYTHAVSSGAVALRPGVERLLAEAHAAGLRLAIVTTTTAANVTALLQATLGDGAEGGFASIVTGERVRAKKPDPEAYTLALAELALAPPQCIAFEDSANGLAAAAAAGLPTIVTPCQWTDHERFTGALAVLEHLGDPGTPLRVSPGIALARPWLSVDDLREGLRHGA